VDPTTLATSAVALALPVLGRSGARLLDTTADELVEAAGHETGTLLDRLRAKLRPGTGGGALLRAAAEAPPGSLLGAERRAALVAAVEAAVAADPVFEAALLDAVEGVTEPAPLRIGGGARFSWN
jgi:hypothetical protein